MNLTIPNKLNKEHTFQSKKNSIHKSQRISRKEFYFKIYRVSAGCKKSKAIKKVKIKNFLIPFNVFKTFEGLKNSSI